MISTLVIASHNKGKADEIRSLLAPFSITVKSAADVNLDEPEETGSTFLANAQLKARNAAAHSKLPSLADDSGLAIPALGGAPGIYSARWAGPNKDFDAAFARIQKELQTIPSPVGGGLVWVHDGAVSANNAPLPTSPLMGEEIRAYFICVLCLCMPGGEEHSFEGRIDGKLTFPPRGKGFGYDPIFIPEGYNVTFGEISAEEKNAISHRARAFEKFQAFLLSS